MKCIKTIAALLTILLLSQLCACNKEDEINADIDAEFSGKNVTYESDGLSVTLDKNFVRVSSSRYSLKCQNNNLVFTAFYMEKFYFENTDVSSTLQALEYTGIGKDEGGVAGVNENGQSYTEYLQTYTEDGVTDTYRMYYVCIEDEERYWFCCFYSPETSFETYRENILGYAKSLTAVYTESES